jgi:hypothetical protein
MLQLLLAVINSNLLKILSNEAFTQIKQMEQVVEVDHNTKPDDIDPSNVADMSTQQ